MSDRFCDHYEIGPCEICQSDEAIQRLEAEVERLRRENETLTKRVADLEARVLPPGWIEAAEDDYRNSVSIEVRLFEPGQAAVSRTLSLTMAMCDREWAKPPALFGPQWTCARSGVATPYNGMSPPAHEAVGSSHRTFADAVRAADALLSRGK